MNFEIGDTVRNSITKKVYTVVNTDEQPYLTLAPVGTEPSEDASPEETISMHQDFLELVEDEA